MISTRADACSRLSLEHDDPIAGTASTATGYLIIEHGGPWGVKPFRDAQFADPDGTLTGLGEHLQQVLGPLGITPLLVRRRGARHGLPSPITVMLVALDEAGGHGVRTTVLAASQIGGWDLPALLGLLRTGATPDGWKPLESQYLVCTHARRDACCGELGRPLAAELAAAEPERTWEVSHLGGHRLAANALVVPDGLVYGRVDPGQAGDLVAAHADGRLLVTALRGRASLAPPVQAAEIALRRATGTDAAAAVRLRDTEADGVRTRTVWSVASRTWQVVMVTVAVEGERPASCGAAPAIAPVRHEVVELAELPGSADDEPRPVAAG